MKRFNDDARFVCKLPNTFMMGLSFWGLLSFDRTIVVNFFVINRQHLCLEEGIQSLLRPIVATLGG